MLFNEKLAVAAHMHVLLRRKTGRVTDTEWMAANADYAAEITRFARERATTDAQPELAEWAERLERAMTPPRPARGPVVPAPAPAEAAPERYVGRLR